MRVVADARVAALDATFAKHGELLALEGRDIRRAHLEKADALLTRTVTRVDRTLLEGTPVRFVGTATIGSDHLDTKWLESAGIRWTAAPGCNADATAQYTLAMFLLACHRLELDPKKLRYGIVGRGNVGSRLMHMLEMLGIACVANDPPLETQGVAGLCSLYDALDCDVISLHVPLTRGGRWPTHRMFDASMFGQLGDRALLINSCRGDVVNGVALTQWLDRGGRAALDVWPGEPKIEVGHLEKAVVATPHIAGYSLDGKYRASAMIYRAFCEHFQLEPSPMPKPPKKPEPASLNTRDPSFAEQLLESCPVERDDAAMRRLLEIPSAQRPEAFDALRSNYPLRRDLVL